MVLRFKNVYEQRKNKNQDAILPNFFFSRFFIFAVKLERFNEQKANLKANNGKINCKIRIFFC